MVSFQSVITCDSSCKDDNADSQHYPLKRCLTNNEEIVVFLGLKVATSDVFLNDFLQYICASHFCRETTIENNHLKH